MSIDRPKSHDESGDNQPIETVRKDDSTCEVRSDNCPPAQDGLSEKSESGSPLPERRYVATFNEGATSLIAEKTDSGWRTVSNPAELNDSGVADESSRPETHAEFDEQRARMEAMSEGIEVIRPALSESEKPKQMEGSDLLAAAAIASAAAAEILTRRFKEQLRPNPASDTPDDPPPLFDESKPLDEEDDDQDDDIEDIFVGRG